MGDYALQATGVCGMNGSKRKGSQKHILNLLQPHCLKLLQVKCGVGEPWFFPILFVTLLVLAAIGKQQVVFLFVFLNDRAPDSDVSGSFLRCYHPTADAFFLGGKEILPIPDYTRMH